MENNTPYNLGFSILKLLSLAEKYSSEYNFSCVNSFTLLMAFASLENYSFYNMLVQNNVPLPKIADAFQTILEDNYSTFEEETIGGAIEFKLLKNPIYISEKLYYVLKLSDEIAKSKYNTDEIEYNEFFIAFVNCFPGFFYLFFDCCDLLSDDSNDIIENEAKRPKKQEGKKVKKKVEIPDELSSCLSILNDSPIATSELQEILGRDKETLELIRILAKEVKSNAIFVGEPGVGKTAIVENFAWLIASGNCPAMFKDSVIVSLDVNSIIAGTHFRGSAEKRFQVLINFLEQNPNCILFVDEVHNLLGAGACRDGDLDLANALKPILSRGNTQVIGATTSNEYVKYFSRDGALKRRFEKIVVNEPKIDELYPMIKNKICRLSTAHGVTISRDLIDKIIFYATCFNFETKNPDRTLDLIDKAMAIAELNGKTEVGIDDVIDNFDVNIKKYENMSLICKTATAYHEAGHYILNRFAPELYNRKVTAVSIMPADAYLGVNAIEIDNNVTVSETRDYFIQLIASLLAGRVAEAMYTSNLSAGACSDLYKDTKIAHDMVTKYALQNNFSTHFVYINEEGYNMYTDEVVNNVNNEVKNITKEAWDYAENMLHTKINYLTALVDALLKSPMLSSKEIDEIFSEVDKNAFSPNNFVVMV